MKTAATALALAVLTNPAAAQAVYESSDGERFRMIENRDGFVMTGPGETIYLGRSCDAFSTQAGAGSWDWANGGFCVSLAAKSICFPRQEVTLGQFDHDISACRMGE